MLCMTLLESSGNKYQEEPIFKKMDKVLQSYNTKKNVRINQQANHDAEYALAKAKHRGNADISTGLMICAMLVKMDEELSLPKKYSMPIYEITKAENVLLEVLDTKTKANSYVIADEMVNTILKKV